MTIPDPLIQFCEWLVKVTWQAAVLVLLVLLIQWVLGRKLTPVWRYNLWLIVLIRLALPVSPQGPWSIFNYPGLNREVVPIGQKFFGTEPEKEINAEKFSHTKEGIVEIVSIPFNSMIDMAYPIVTSLVQEGQNSKSGFIHWIFFKVDRMNLFICVWSAGFLFFGIRALRNYRLLFRHVNELDPVKDYRALRIWEDARQKINCAAEVTLVESDLVHSPALCGFLKYRLLLPPGMIRHFSDAELKMVFLHELAHLKRGDVQINWFATVFQLLHWFNPVLWWGLKCMRTDREIAADAMVLMNSDGKERKAYGRTIIRLLEGFSPTPSAGMVGLLEDDEQFKRRIQTMATFKGPIPSWSLLGCCVVMLLGAVGLTDRPDSVLVRQSEAKIVELKMDEPGKGTSPLFFSNSESQLVRMVKESKFTHLLTKDAETGPENSGNTIQTQAITGPTERTLHTEDFVESMRPFGTWTDHPKFGESWIPNVSRWNRSWRPYLNKGQWIEVGESYYWKSQYIWGETAFHYGTWGFDEQSKYWFWVPDDEYSSGKVEWRSTPYFIGWAPMKPRLVTDEIGIESSEREAQPFIFVPANAVFLPDVQNSVLSQYWSGRVFEQSHATEYPM